MRFLFALLLSAGCIPGNIWVVEGEGGSDASVKPGSDASTSGGTDARADSGTVLPGQDAGGEADTMRAPR